MSGGEISGNNAGASDYGGGGVYAREGTFTMSDGKISNNSATNNGGGVYVDSGTFTMNDGTISGNTAISTGGVSVNNGTFEMNGGTISDNTAKQGGGVYVNNSTFTMSGGTISDNTATNDAGGVYVNNSTFTMSGGTISNNTAKQGGGVYVESGTFTKESGGTIYGSNDNTLKNTATDGDAYGYAVFVSSGSKKRNSTAGAGVTLDSGTSANWEYVVTFDADGGTPTPQPLIVCGGDSAGTLPTGLTRSNCTFDGWYTAQNGGGTAFAADTPVNDNITVYAKWKSSAPIDITLPPMSSDGDDPTLSNQDVPVNASASFSVGNGYSSHKWYWNGVVINGETSATYTLPANSKTPGVYELSVVVRTTGGEYLSARCRVTITN